MLALGFAIVTLGFAVTPASAAAPIVTSFAPNTGTIGTSVTLTGSGFTGATIVTFHGVTATFKIVSDTKITATAPKTVSTGTISVTTPGGTGTSAASFTVTPGMTLSRTSGPPLAAVEGDGAGFHKNTAVDVYF